MLTKWLLFWTLSAVCLYLISGHSMSQNHDAFLYHIHVHYCTGGICTSTNSLTYLTPCNLIYMYNLAIDQVVMSW